MPNYYTSETRDGAEVTNIGHDQLNLSTGDINYNVIHNHIYDPVRVACHHLCKPSLKAQYHSHNINSTSAAVVPPIEERHCCSGSPAGYYWGEEGHVLEDTPSEGDTSGSAVSNFSVLVYKKNSSLNHRHLRGSRVHPYTY